MDLSKEIEKLILNTLKDTVPVNIKKQRSTGFIDRNTAAMGFSKITKTGYTP